MKKDIMKKKRLGEKVINVVDKFFVAITLIYLILIGIFLMYSMVLVNFDSFFIILLVFFILFVLDVILFIRRKKSFIYVSIFLFSVVLIDIIFAVYISGLSLGGFGVKVYMLFIILPAIISILTLIFSKTIKKYLHIIN